MRVGNGFVISEPERVSEGVVMCTVTVTRWRYRLMWLKALAGIVRDTAWR